MLAMMADNIEHVISYWLLYQKFQSPTLAGFAVLVHWTPFLLFSVYLAPWQIAMIAAKSFSWRSSCMGVSAAWAFLFWTDTIEVGTLVCC